MALKLGFATVQRERFCREILPRAANLTSIVIEDGQPVSIIAKILSDQGSSLTKVGDRSAEHVAMIRVSNYIGSNADAAILLDTVKEKAETADWVVLHVGATVVPFSLVQLARFIVALPLGRPRFLLVVEDLDYLCASPELGQLTQLSPPCGLIEDRSFEYFLQIPCPGDGQPSEVVKSLVRLHMRVLGSSLDTYLKSLRSPASAIEVINASLSWEDATDLVYLAGLEPDSPEYHLMARLISEEENHETAT
ncbi:MAG: hypothetical protein ACRDRS_00010 [Pseudonocardiaceae bacterium]